MAKGLVGCSWYAEVSIYQKVQEWTTGKEPQGHGHRRLIDAHGE